VALVVAARSRFHLPPFLKRFRPFLPKDVPFQIRESIQDLCDGCFSLPLDFRKKIAGGYLTSRLFGTVGIAAPVKAEAAMTVKT
jgi:hypothetical protein